MCIHTHTEIYTHNEKKVMDLQKSKKEYMGGFGKRKGKGKSYNYNIKRIFLIKRGMEGERDLMSAGAGRGQRR